MCAGGYFTLDLVAACPYDMLVRAAGGGDRFQAFLRLFKLLRLQRVILWYRRKARLELIVPFPHYQDAALATCIEILRPLPINPCCFMQCSITTQH